VRLAAGHGATQVRLIGSVARGEDRHPEVPWPQIVALRNILVHEYFGLNMEQVWTMARKDLPELEKQVRHIRSQIAPEPGFGN
jgi:uncharacterized protein with HEPN domain